MKKKTFTGLALFMLLVIAVFSFSGCGLLPKAHHSSESNEPDSATETVEDAENAEDAEAVEGGWTVKVDGVKGSGVEPVGKIVATDSASANSAEWVTVSGKGGDDIHVDIDKKNREILINSEKSGLITGGGLVIDISLPVSKIEIDEGSFFIDMKVTEKTFSGSFGGALSGNISFEETEDVKLVFSGAGALELKGETQNLEIIVEGTGAIDGRNLISKDATIVVEGAGYCSVIVDEVLDATVEGVGMIEYGGKAKDVKTTIEGVGVIQQGL